MGEFFAWVGFALLCVLAYLAYKSWDVVLTGAIVFGSVAAVWAAIFYGMRSWISLEYVSPVAKHVRSGRHDLALDRATSIRQLNGDILESNEERQLLAVLPGLRGGNAAIAADVQRWRKQLEHELRGKGGIDDRLRAARANPHIEKFQKGLLQELARTHGMKIE